MNHPSTPKPPQQLTTLTPPPSATLPPTKRACLDPSLLKIEQPSQKTVKALPKDLGKLIEEDTIVLKELGWKKFVQLKRGRGDLGPLNFNHPISRILKQYKKHSAPVKFSTPPWSEAYLQSKLHWGPHQSCHEHLEFLQEEFVDMINKKQWIILPYDTARQLPGLRLYHPLVLCPNKNNVPVGFTTIPTTKSTMKLWSSSARNQCNLDMH